MVPADRMSVPSILADRAVPRWVFLSLNTSSLSSGSHTITVTATDSDATPDSGSFSVTVTVQATPPTVWIDSPASGSDISGTVTVAGWAIDSSSAVGTAISSVQGKGEGAVAGGAWHGVS